ncbi:MAG: hypothetical protein RI922_2202 [Bacteroidota bacterium]|jgi:hypothetical protein
MKKHILILSTALLCINAFAQVPNYVPTNGLVGWWPFNGNANDESGNGNNGTVNGATLTTDRFGVANKAYSFDGASSIKNPPLQLGSEFSISLNFSLEIINQPYSALIGNWQGASNLNGFEISKRNNNSIGFTYSDNGSNATTLESSTIFNPSITWYQMTIVNDNQQLKLYLNGLLESQLANSAMVFFNGDSLIFGATRNAIIGDPISYFWNGKLDDIGIWNRALTQCEIADLYNAQLGSLNSSSTLNETALDSYTLNGQTYTQSGTYTQNLPNAAGCDSTITLNLSLNFTGLNELENTISIAPNPATDQLTISSSSSINEKYILFDPQGRAILSGKLSGTTTQLDLSKLARGNYLLQIGEKLTPVKLVKE